MRIRIDEQVKFYAPTHLPYYARPHTSLTMTDLAKKVRSMRTTLKESQRKFGDRFGVDQSTVSRWETGASPDFEHIGPLSDLAGRMIKDMPLPDVNNLRANLTNTVDILVIGAVQAGEWVEAIEWPQDEWKLISIPLTNDFRDMKTFALEVRGPSMNRRYPDGSYVVCVKLIDWGKDPEHGQRVVVQRRNGNGLIEATVKELRIDGDGGKWLWPDSDHPEHQAPLSVEGEDVEITALVVWAVKSEL